MRKTLEVYRSIAEQAPDAIFVTDPEGRVIYQNPAARAAFGFDDEEIFQHRIHEKIHYRPADDTSFPNENREVYQAAQYGEAMHDSTRRVFRKDGSSFYASCSTSPLYFENERIGALFIATDITAKQEAEEALLKSKEQLQLATSAADLGLFDHNLVTGRLDWSGKIKEHFGLAPDTLVTSLDVPLAQIHPDDQEKALQAMQLASTARSDGRYEFECRTVDRQDGKMRWIISRGRWLFDDSGKVMRRIGVTLDITERKLAEQRLIEASQHDALTGLPNRSLLFEYCNHLIAIAKRAGTGGGAVLFIDLDRFKPINDLYGHDIGDKVLQEVAQRLRACTRQEDLPCRLGGDEFVVVLPRVDSTYGPMTVAQHILTFIGKPIQVGDLQLSVTPSIGISLFPRHASDLDTLIRYADLAMYSSKKAGKNTFTMYTPGLDEQNNRRLRIEMQLKQALDSGGMTLVYQPVIDMESEAPVGAEALVRLRDENGSLISAAELIPIAEAAGLMDRLGEWVAAEACRQHRHWREAGLPSFSIAINVSPVQFRHRTLASHLAAAIEQSGIDPQCLQVEIPESVVMENIPTAIATLNEIRALGIKVVLDDFGVGYSSLGNLGSLPLDKLKIDKSLTCRTHDDDSQRPVTGGIIALGRSLHLEVIGEGIESEEMMDYLRRHGCNQVQGYLFSQPLPPTEFEAWYRTRLGHYH